MRGFGENLGLGILGTAAQNPVGISGSCGNFGNFHTGNFQNSRNCPIPVFSLFPGFWVPAPGRGIFPEPPGVGVGVRLGIPEAPGKVFRGFPGWGRDGIRRGEEREKLGKV